jgi:hypothetical protein
MARATIAVQQINSPYGVGSKVTFTAASVADKNQYVAGNGDFIMARNSGASPRTLTVTSVACPEGRTEDVVLTIPAGETWQTGIIPKTGFKQADGKVYIEADNAEVLIAVLRQR